MRPTAPPQLFGRVVRHIHCLGVGGMGMAQLALYLAQSGFTVSGEDDALTDEVRAVLAGGPVRLEPLPASCDLVTYSSAIPPGHAVCRAAAARGLPLVRRGELLAEVARGRRLVAVCGAHGKTTTTAMLATVLRAANFPAGYILGGLFRDGSPPARAGSNAWLVAEVDESDGTIDAFSPEITVAVNLDWDHPDHYPQASDFAAAFAALFARTTGAVLVSDACARSLRAAAPAGGAVPRLVFGRTGDFSGEAGPGEAGCMTLRLGGRFAASRSVVRAQGAFNAANALAALAAAQLMGVPAAPDALAGYPGVCRRQVELFAGDGLAVIEDYAHHPTEIRALLASLRERAGAAGRLIVVFQPHRYSRTLQFKAEFAAALALADRVHLLDVYAAGETPIAGGTTADIYAAMKERTAALPVSYVPGGEQELRRALAREAHRGDVVAFVGAGDIDRHARAWTAELEEARRQARRWDEFAAEVRPGLSSGTKLRREEPLAARTTLRVGGSARLYAEPAGVDDLRRLLQAAAARGIPHFILGRGSNLIVPDAGVDGLVLSFSHPVWSRGEPQPDGSIRVGAGLRLKRLCGIAAQAGLAGFEFLEGIPGSVGGALRMNAGAMGGWIFDVVEEVEVMREDGEVRTLKKAEMHVDYRHCAELHHAIALGALLKGRAAVPVRTGHGHPARVVDEHGLEAHATIAGGDTRAATPAAIARQIDVYRSKRHESQPREPSAGCVFKNPPGDSAGRLIDQSGLKGERVGDAEVSPVHANFIINRGRATSADVLELIRRVRAQVQRSQGVTLEPEVLLYGAKWEDVL